LLSAENEDTAEKWLLEKFPDHLFPFMKFRLRDSKLFPSHMFNKQVTENMSPENWWKLIKMKNEKREDENKLQADFFNFFISLHCCPASSGSIERIFSTLGLVWSNLRNKLGTEKAMKLVRIYRELRSKRVE